MNAVPVQHYRMGKSNSSETCFSDFNEQKPGGLPTSFLYI